MKRQRLSEREEGEAVSEGRFAHPTRTGSLTSLCNELTVDEVDAGSVCVTVEGTGMTPCSGPASPHARDQRPFRLPGIVLPEGGD